MSNKLVRAGQVTAFEYPNVSLTNRDHPSQSANPFQEDAAGESERGDGPKAPDQIEKEAFQAGYEAGEKSGLEMGEQKVEATLRRLADSLKELALLRETIVSESEQDLIKLAIEIAKKLVHREVQIDERIILTLLRVALEKLNEEGRITVFVEPSDHEVLRRNLDEIYPQGKETKLVLKVDESMDRGDCRLESEFGSIDARISEQFQEIEKGLLSEF